MVLRKFLERLCVLLVLFCFLAAGLSYAQASTGKITGTVTDNEDTALPGVSVELTSSVLMGGVHGQISSARGVYRFSELPPGIYTVVFSIEGFQTVVRENLRVTIGKTTTVNIALSQEAISESIVVTAPSPVVDVTQSGLSSIIDKDLIEKIPIGRGGVGDIIKQAPGIVSGYGASGSSRVIGQGSNYESSAWLLDGVDVSNLDLGFGWVSVNQEVMAEVETSGVGSDAEFGQFTGAVVSVVTKSGGNRFAGTLGYFGEYQGLRADNNPDPEKYYSAKVQKWHEIVVVLGGPILKDKLWFFGSYNPNIRKQTSWNRDPAYPSESKPWGVYFKLSSQLGQAHRLVGSFRSRHSDPRPSIPPTYTPEAMVNQVGNTYFWNTEYTWMMSNNAYSEFKYSGYWTEANEMPVYGGSINDPAHRDLATGLRSGAPYYPYLWWGDRHQVHAKTSYFAEDFLGGDHDFKIGAQFKRARADCEAGYSGGKVYWDWNGANYLLYTQDAFHYGSVATDIGAFFDDHMKLGERLTVHVGVRYDRSRASYPPYPYLDGWTRTSRTSEPVDNLFTWNSISPRLGLALQLTSDQKTVLRASIGRYYDSLHLGHTETPGPAVSDWSYWEWSGTSWEKLFTVGGQTGYIIDKNTKNPYADQLQIGLEREILANFSAGVTFLYKKEKDGVGFENRGGIYERVPVVSADNGMTYQAYNQTNVGTNEIWLTNPSIFEQSYRSLTFALNKRYSNKWMMNASLTWSRNEGINQGSHSTSRGVGGTAIIALYNTRYGKDPNDWINSNGLMPHDRTWVFKLQTSYTLPWDITMSANYMAFTGQPIPNFVRIRVNQGSRKILAEPRGELRFDMLTMLDFRLQKTFNLSKGARLSALIDVFNVFNVNTVTQYRSYNLYSSRYEETSAFPAARRGQIGIKFEF